ncbi:hypothetical protein AB0436_12205 [Streptomyces sp. NPDC051322]|uniref:hypothetical protein n=1 Tax=Streptomyces sp. NPDC051322 TaxID=3154645 RepID=UPI00344C17C4
MNRLVVGQFPAGGPRGSWPAEEYAAAQRAAGKPVEVVMDLETDAFLVVCRGENTE